MNFFAPALTRSDVRASQSQNPFFREIGFSAVIGVWFVRIAPNQKNDYQIIDKYSGKLPFQRNFRIQNRTSGSGVIAQKLWQFFCGRGDEVGSCGLVFPPIAFKLSEKMDIVCRHVSLRKNIAT